jgi:hypothetical protein
MAGGFQPVGGGAGPIGPCASMMTSGTPTTLTTAGTFYEFGSSAGWTSVLPLHWTNAATTATAAFSGYYTVSFSVSFELAGAENLEFQIYLNDAQAQGASFIASKAPASESHCISGTIVLYVAAGDTISLWVSCLATSSLSPNWTASSLAIYGFVS